MNGEATSYYLESAAVLVPEPDAARLVTAVAHDLIQKVRRRLE